MTNIICECRHELHREFECGDGCRCERDESEVLRAHIAKLEEAARRIVELRKDIIENKEVGIDARYVALIAEPLAELLK